MTLLDHAERTSSATLLVRPFPHAMNDQAWPSPAPGIALSRASTAARRSAISRGGALLFLSLTLLLRVLTDDLSSPDSRNSGNLNLSAAIAALFIAVAIGTTLRRRNATTYALLAVLWVGVWTAVAVATHGASALSVREGVREVSVVALATIVYGSFGRVTVTWSARLIQLLALAPAAVALVQLDSGTGMNVAGEIRSNGTFAHPNSAAMFFAIAAAASLWVYLDCGKRRLDAALTAIFAAALISTASIDGTITLAAMFAALGVLRHDSSRANLLAYSASAAVVLALFASPLGHQRVSEESRTTEGVTAYTSLGWRLHKWEQLLRQWEGSPVFGRGLGATVTETGIVGNLYAGEPPHNEYIRYLVETGVAGLALLLCGLGALTRRLVDLRAAENAARARPSNATTFAIVVLLGCLINALAENTFLNTPTCYAAALVLGAALGAPRLRRELAR
jgi:O-antigen ligase